MSALRPVGRSDRVLRHLAVLIFAAGFIALGYELSADHRACTDPPLSRGAYTPADGGEG